MIATGNHFHYRFAARSTTGVAIRIPLKTLNYPGFFAVITEDMIYCPTDRFLPHFSSYSRETGFSFTLTSAKPAMARMRSNSSTEEAPLTQQECISGSSLMLWGISL